MLGLKDNDLVRETAGIYDFSVSTVIGDRAEQQDSFAFLLQPNRAFVAICDGMGGHRGGKLAGKLAARTMLEACSGASDDDPVSLLQRAAELADRKISQLTDESGARMNAGSTLSSVLLLGRTLYWCAIGDSRIYLLRGDEFVQLTQDQNYKTVLNAQLHTGAITQEEYDRNLYRADALISFIGIGNLKLVDYNQRPFTLEPKDKLILMSDGVYRVLPEEEIKSVIMNFSNPADALQMLEYKIQKEAKKNKRSRDNTTAAILKIL